MARKKAGKRTTVKNATPKFSSGIPGFDEGVQNGLSGAVGLGQFNPFGFPQNQGFPGTEQISNVNTTFKNLRWYLISNFRQFLSELYVEIALVQTVVDLPVDDALRGGIDIFSSQLEEHQIKELQISLERDDDLNTVGKAAKWNRLFGGSGIVVLTDQDPEEELDVDAITEDSNLAFRAVDMWELFYSLQNTDGYDPSIQSEDYTHFDYYGEQLHKSRVMKMKGLEAPSFIRPKLRGWGFSETEKLIRSINQYLKATDLSFEVLDEFKLDVYKMKNLVSTLMNPRGEQQVRMRIQQNNFMKNYQNALVLDKEDDFDHKQLSFAGLAEVMAGIRKQVASDMRFPLTKLFGSSESGGIGNNDQNDMENYNAMVESTVRNKIKYPLLRVCELKCQKLFGMIPDDLEIKFRPLRMLSAVDEEAVKTQKFARIQQASESGRITNFEYREAVNKGALMDITLDNSGDELNPDDPDIGDLVETGGLDNPEDPKDIDDPGTDRADTKKPHWPAGEYGGNRDKKKNSAAFDRASYEADGGDGWIDGRNAAFYEDPVGVDRALWYKARHASVDAFGSVKWQFVVWWYLKQGGKFQ